jgi:hypothetical protein
MCLVQGPLTAGVFVSQEAIAHFSARDSLHMPFGNKRRESLMTSRIVSTSGG